MMKHRLVWNCLFLVGGILLTGCENDVCYLNEQEAEIHALELGLIKRQKKEFIAQMDKQDAIIRRTEAELTKLERANYLNNLRLELLKMKDETSQELRERLVETREEKARLEAERRDLFFMKNARLQKLRKANNAVQGADSFRSEISELQDALLEQKVMSEKLAKKEETVIQPVVNIFGQPGSGAEPR